MFAVENDAMLVKGLELSSDGRCVANEDVVGVILAVQCCKNKVKATVYTIGIFFGQMRIVVDGLQNHRSGVGILRCKYM